MDTLKPLVLNPPPNIIKVTNFELLEQLIQWLEVNKEIGFDVETTPVKDYFNRKCRTIQFGRSDVQYVIDLKAFCSDSDELYSIQGYYGLKLTGGVAKVMERLRPYLVSKDWLKVGVTLSFEYMTLYWNFGIRSVGYYDCSLAEKAIYAGFHSLKDYDFYSMAEMFGRYFGMNIDKSLQESFNLDDELSDAQFEYAALDTRTPLAIKIIQTLIAEGQTSNSLGKQGKPGLARFLSKLDPLLLGDKLTTTISIENDAIGAFQDMYVHGEFFDTERWMKRVNAKKIEFNELILKKLDPIFLPLVGSKYDVITEADIQAAKQKWKFYNNITAEELEAKKQIRIATKTGDAERLNTNTIFLQKLEQERKDKKEVLKKEERELGKRRTKLNKLANDCEGEALINYSSDAQLKRAIKDHFPKLKIDSLDDDTLVKFKHVPVIAAIQEYHILAKELSTYGAPWAMKWVTHPCNEEGWLHPGDGKIHHTYNQYDAETGRSSSEKPNGQNLPGEEEIRSCYHAGPPDEDAPEGYVYVTADMSGAELRIIAEDANDEGWIWAFKRGEDVHSIGASGMYKDIWPATALPSCRFFSIHDEHSVAENPNCVIGQPMRRKCGCPEHKSKRNIAKAPNFLLAYGGGPAALVASINKEAKTAKDTIDFNEAKSIMTKHEQINPNIWKYLDESGKTARMMRKAFDLAGRRRIFPPPTNERAAELYTDKWPERLELEEEDQEKNISEFMMMFKRKPTAEEKFTLTHRKPSSNEIAKQYIAMESGIERQGKNHRIQGTNATIAKKAMGAGFDKNGEPYLWWTLPNFKAQLVKFVHDELVIRCPKRFAKEVAELVGSAFRRAAAEFMTKVIMEFEFNISPVWAK